MSESSDDEFFDAQEDQEEPSSRNSGALAVKERDEKGVQGASPLENDLPSPPAPAPASAAASSNEEEMVNSVSGSHATSTRPIDMDIPSSPTVAVTAEDRPDGREPSAMQPPKPANSLTDVGDDSQRAVAGQAEGAGPSDMPDGNTVSISMAMPAIVPSERAHPSFSASKHKRSRRSPVSWFPRMSSPTKGNSSMKFRSSSSSTPLSTSGPVSTSGETTRSESTSSVSRYNDIAAYDTGGSHGNFNVAGSGIIIGGGEPTSNGGGQQPTDAEILEAVLVKNLDTGETIPLSEAEKRIPVGLDPLALHIMRLTSEFIGDDGEVQSQGDSNPQATAHAAAHHVKQKGKKALKVLRGKVKSLKTHLDAHDDPAEVVPESTDAVRFKASSSHRGPYEFDKFALKQDMSKEHMGPVWSLQFSTDGRLLASAGQDLLVRVWVLRKARSCFDDMKSKYARDGQGDSVVGGPVGKGKTDTMEDEDVLFEPKPFCVFSGHTSDILDLAWSKNYFLLSASFDKTVRLWHVSRHECLACFQHTEFVTGIAFHPRDDRYFLSGSLDSRLRLWNIPDKKVALWNEVEGPGNRLITAANFVQNGKYAVAGTYDGRCLLYETEYLKYHTQIHARSSRGKNARGRKITGIVPMPGEDKILISSNDSRVRLYDLKDHSLVCKYKGATNRTSQIEASFSSDGSHIISGSENGHVYVWRTYHDFSRAPPTTRRDLNEYYESFAGPTCTPANELPRITAAVFAPVPGLFAGEGIRDEPEVVVAADFEGGIRVYTKALSLPVPVVA